MRRKGQEKENERLIRKRKDKKGKKKSRKGEGKVKKKEKIGFKRLKKSKA